MLDKIENSKTMPISGYMQVLSFEVFKEIEEDEPCQNL
jgi:hypothetical protein